MLMFCNEYTTDLWFAVSHLSLDQCGGPGGDWRSIGWWYLPNDPTGNCWVVYTGKPGELNRYWYYYAEAADGVKWTGPYRSQVSYPGPFKHCDGFTAPGAVWRNFRELDVGDADMVDVIFTT